jgi:glycosyltransferase 2 family protein
MLKVLKLFFWLTGLSLLVWAINSTDLSSVGVLLTKMKLGIVAVLSVYIIINLMDAIAWKFTLKPNEANGVKVWTLWKIRQIGEALNMATPFGTVGGEPAKAQLLKETYGLNYKQAISSLVATRTTNLIGLVFFLAWGAVLIWQSDTISGTFKTTCQWALGIFSTLIFLFLIFQIAGFLEKIAKRIGKFSFINPKAKSFLEEIETLSHHMADYYKNHGGRFALSIWYSFVGWVLGILELYLALYFLGFSLSFTDLWIIEALTQLLKVGSFFIPLGIGAMESGLILIFSSMGMTPNLGLTVSIVRRIKELTWIALGLALSGQLVFKK